MFRLGMGPGIFRIRPVVGEIRSEPFQIIRDGEDYSQPVLKINKPLETKEFRDFFTMASKTDLPQKLQELNKADM